MQFPQLKLWSRGMKLGWLASPLFEVFAINYVSVLYALLNYPNEFHLISWNLIWGV